MIKHSTKNRIKPVHNMDNAPIYVEITFNCQRARYYPGFNIHSSQWDKDSQSVIRKRNGKTYVNACGQTADIINAYLARVRVAVDKVFERYEYENKTPHPQYLLDDIRAELDDNKKDVESRESVFDYAITDDERAAMGIPKRDQYEPIIKKDRNLGIMHIALLMQKRGDVVKSLEYVSKLPDAMKVQYMQTITNPK